MSHTNDWLDALEKNKTLRDENERLRDELAEATRINEHLLSDVRCLNENLDALKASEPVAYLVGNTYQRMDGTFAKIIGVGNQTVFDEDGCHYYNRSGDRGRVTGTAHDYSHPRNLVRLYATPQPASEDARDAARYRFIRSPAAAGIDLGAYGDKLDARIDEAMKGTKP